MREKERGRREEIEKGRFKKKKLEIERERIECVKMKQKVIGKEWSGKEKKCVRGREREGEERERIRAKRK